MALDAWRADSLTDAHGYLDRRNRINAASGLMSAIMASVNSARSGDNGKPSGVSLLLHAPQTRVQCVGSLITSKRQIVPSPIGVCRKRLAWSWCWHWCRLALLLRLPRIQPHGMRDTPVACGLAA